MPSHMLALLGVVMYALVSLCLFDYWHIKYTSGCGQIYNHGH
jgi:hypothetical protein